jgi:hypothetical protein
MPNEFIDGANEIILVYNASLNNRDPSRYISPLKKALRKINYLVDLEIPLSDGNLPEFLDQVRNSKARHVISLVDDKDECSAILRMPNSFNEPEAIGAQDIMGLEALEVLVDIKVDFFGQLYGIFAGTQRFALILSLIEVAAHYEDDLDLSTAHDNYAVRLSRKDWLSTPNDDLENAFLNAIKLFLEPRTSSRRNEIQNPIDTEDIQPTHIREVVNRISIPLCAIVEDEIGISDETINVFTGFVSRCNLSGNGLPNEKILLARNAIAAMTMARRLSSLNLEGEKFNCWIISVDAYSGDVTRGLETLGFRRFLSLHENVIFSIDHESKVRDIVELGLSDSVFLLVDWRTNRIHSVWRKSNDIGSLIAVLPNDLFHYALHVRPDERVEFYGRSNTPNLVWDGFKWRPPATSTLLNLLNIHKDQLEIDVGVAKKVADATDKLLDSGCSSIFVIIHPNDIAKINKVSDRSLRSNLLPPNGFFRPVVIDEVQPNQLANFLKLDGSHFFYKEKLLQICCNLKLLDGHWHSCVPTDEVRRGINDWIFDQTFDFRRVGFTFSDAEDSLHVRISPRNEEELERFINYMKVAPNESPIDTFLLDSLGLYRTSTKLIGQRQISGQNVLYCEERQFSADLSRDPDYRLLVKIPVPEKGNEVIPVTEGLYHADAADGEGFDVFIDLKKIEDVRNGLSSSTWEYSPSILQVLDQWLLSGRITESGSLGTGTRAAKAASKALPESLVVKVSASGKLYLFMNGTDARI